MRKSDECCSSFPKGRVSDQDTVLIMGSYGGVWSSVVQLAKIRGATVIAIVGKNKEHLVKELGGNGYRNCQQK